jgi:hypothetical protein
MNKNFENLPLRTISGIVAVITFLADLITVALFIRDLLQNRITFIAVIAEVALIVIVFAFAFLLLVYSKQAEATPDWLIRIFSWLYIVFSAAIFGIISQRFIIEGDYRFGEYIGYILLIILIAGLGYSIAIFTRERAGYFSIPFMLVALEQIILWIFLIFSRTQISFNWTMLGNLFLFLIVSMFVLYFIWIDTIYRWGKASFSG